MARQRVWQRADDIDSRWRSQRQPAASRDGTAVGLARMVRATEAARLLEKAGSALAQPKANRQNWCSGHLMFFCSANACPAAAW